MMTTLVEGARALLAEASASQLTSALDLTEFGGIRAPWTNPLTVTNATGSLAARYSTSSVATNADAKGLKDQLVLTIKTGVTTCTNAGSAATGTSIYTGDLDSTAGKLVGDVAQGAQAGDRALAAGVASETLCFQVSLPSATGNACTSAATTATFTFDAEQTANN